MNAWPALQTIHFDGWIIRFADGVTKRSNSVNPLYASNLDIYRKIDYCERLYRSKKLPACFKINGNTEPPDLDSILEKFGYTHEFDISVQLINTTKFSISIDSNVNINEFLDDPWLDNYIRMNDMDLSIKPVFKRIIDQIIYPKCLLTIKLNGSIVGCGLGVAEDKHIGLFDITVDKQYRNQGLGKILVENILRWGKNKGAEIGYLQVLIDNAPAIRLYEKIGFKEEYKYWYRIKE